VSEARSKKAKKKPRAAVHRGDAVVPVIDLREPMERDDLIVEEALAWVAAGKTLASYCRQPGRPDTRSFRRWCDRDPDLLARYELARRIGYDVLAEEIIDLVDAPVPKDDMGKTDTGIVQQRKLQAEVRMKLLACWFPTRYSEKLTVAGDAANPVQVQHTHQLNDQQVAARIEAILAGARARKRAELAAAGEVPQLAPPREAEFKVVEPELAAPPVPRSADDIPPMWLDLAVDRGMARDRGGIGGRTPEVVGFAASDTIAVLAGRIGNAITWVQEMPVGPHVIEWVARVAFTMPVAIVVGDAISQALVQQLRARRMTVVEVDGDELWPVLHQHLDPSSGKLALPKNTGRSRAHLLAVAATLADVPDDVRDEIVRRLATASTLTE